MGVSAWGITLLLEAVVYIVFGVLVALEFVASAILIDTSLGSEVRKSIYLVVFVGSLFRLLAIITHVFIPIPAYGCVVVSDLLETITGMLFSTGVCLQVIFLIQIYYALLGMVQPQLKRLFLVVILSLYTSVFILVSLGLWINIHFILLCIHVLVALVNLFCMGVMLFYGSQIYVEMRRLLVSMGIVWKMLLILIINTSTFFIRALYEVLMVFGVVYIDMEQCVIRGEIEFHDGRIAISTMFCFFFYFIIEIAPLSITLVSTYIKPKSNTQKDYSRVDFSGNKKVEDEKKEMSRVMKFVERLKGLARTSVHQIKKRKSTDTEMMSLLHENNSDSLVSRKASNRGRMSVS